MRRRAWLIAVAALAVATGFGCTSQSPAQTAGAPARKPDVPYEPSPPEVVRAMLELAHVGKDDVVYDLGSGDGRIVIMAAQAFGARAVGIDIDPQRIAEANENARRAGVADRVKFVQGDLFTADFSEANVVTMFLWPDVNMKLRPKLRTLKPGTRIVSHVHDLGDWAPDQTIRVPIDGGSRQRTVYLWTVRAS